jgi:hypothetical protein
LSPAPASYIITGLSLVIIQFVLLHQVTGKVLPQTWFRPTSTNLTTAVREHAGADAAGRPSQISLNLGAGSMGGKTLTAGLYKFTVR